VTRLEYMEAIRVAALVAGANLDDNFRVSNTAGANIIAMRLPRHILQAIVEGNIVADEVDKPLRRIPFDEPWVEVCRQELADRILIGDPNEGEELQAETGPKES
jgi:hypothetical protein